jgi:hypothetical protein
VQRATNATDQSKISDEPWQNRPIRIHKLTSYSQMSESESDGYNEDEVENESTLLIENYISKESLQVMLFQPMSNKEVCNALLREFGPQDGISVASIKRMKTKYGIFKHSQLPADEVKTLVNDAVAEVFR